MTVYWQVQGNSQELNFGGSDYAHGYVKLYEAGAVSPVTLQDRSVPSTYFPDWNTAQSTVISAFQGGGVTNIVSLRIGLVSDALYSSVYSNNIANWSAAAITFLQNYRNAGAKICLLTSFAAPTGGSYNIRHDGVDAIIRGWLGTYYDTLADIASDSRIGPDATINDTTYFDVTGHMKDAGQAVVYQYFKPAMDALVNPGARMIWSSTR